MRRGVKDFLPPRPLPLQPVGPAGRAFWKARPAS